MLFAAKHHKPQHPTDNDQRGYGPPGDPGPGIPGSKWSLTTRHLRSSIVETDWLVTSTAGTRWLLRKKNWPMG